MIKGIVSLVLLLTSINVSAQVLLLERKITPTQTEASIEFFLNEVRSKFEVSIFYDNNKIRVNKTVIVKKEETTVKQLLEEILKGEGIKVIIRGNNIVLKKNDSSSAKKPNKKATIKGYIRDFDTGENLIGAHAFHVESASGSSSNNYGFYSITLPVGQVSISYSYVGYKQWKHSFNLKNDTVINVNLANELLDEVIISAQKPIPIQETTEMGTINISSKQIKSRPALMGEVDVIKVLQLMPGVQSGREGSSGLYVRGGGPDQNLILLDGVPVYNVSHLFGFMSVFNADAINDVKLIKGAFPARYGGRLSSVIDISTKEGNSKEIKGEGSIGLIAAKLTVEGPIKKDKTSFIISARRTYLDLLARPFINNEKTVPDFNNKTEKTDAGYYFYDFNAKINHKLSDKDRLYLSAYTGRDSGFRNYTTTEEVNFGTDSNLESWSETIDDLEWGSAIALLRWNHIINPKLFSNLSLSYSQYDFYSENRFYEEVESEDEVITDFQNFKVSSKIEDWSALVDFDFYPNPAHHIRFGFKGISHSFSPNIVALRSENRENVTFNTNSIGTTEYATYIEDNVDFSERIKANVGVHASGFHVNNTFFKSIQPRISARYLINDNLAFKGSYSKMTQFIHLLTNPGVGLPTDFWVPATDRVKPQESDQFALGLAHTNDTKNIEISAEGFYKTMDNLIEYKEGAGFLNLDENWQDKIETGSGKSYGVEFFVSKSFSKTDGWLGYTLSWSERTFEDLNFGETFPFKYDRRHDVSLVVNHKLTDNILISANWVLGTGTSITLPIAEYKGVLSHHLDDGSFMTIQQYRSRNSFRMRAYHRADVSITFHKKKKKWGSRDWIVSIYNVYNRKNPFYVEQRVVQDFNQIDRPNKFREITLFPIIPSVSYHFKF